MASESEHGKDRGAVLVETAFVLLLLMMLLIGTVTAAIALGRDNSIQNAAREASRFGATLDGGGTTSWFDDVIGVARAAALGDLDTAVDGQYICVAYWDGAVWGRQTETGGSPGAAADDCFDFDDGRPANEVRVQVVTQRDTPFNAIVWSTDITLVAEASARYERSP